MLCGRDGRQLPLVERVGEGVDVARRRCEHGGKVVRHLAAIIAEFSHDVVAHDGRRRWGRRRGRRRHRVALDRRHLVLDAERAGPIRLLFIRFDDHGGELGFCREPPFKVGVVVSAVGSVRLTSIVAGVRVELAAAVATLVVVRARCDRHCAVLVVHLAARPFGRVGRDRPIRSDEPHLFHDELPATRFWAIGIVEHVGPPNAHRVHIQAARIARRLDRYVRVAALDLVGALDPVGRGYVVRQMASTARVGRGGGGGSRRDARRARGGDGGGGALRHLQRLGVANDLVVARETGVELHELAVVLVVAVGEAEEPRRLTEGEHRDRHAFDTTLVARGELALHKARKAEVRERVRALAPRADDEGLVALIRVGVEARRRERAVPRVCQGRERHGELHGVRGAVAGESVVEDRVVGLGPQAHLGAHKHVVVRVRGTDEDGALGRHAPKVLAAAVGAVAVQRAQKVDRRHPGEAGRQHHAHAVESDAARAAEHDVAGVVHGEEYLDRAVLVDGDDVVGRLSVDVTDVDLCKVARADLHAVGVAKRHRVHLDRVDQVHLHAARVGGGARVELVDAVAPFAGRVSAPRPVVQGVLVHARHPRSGGALSVVVESVDVWQA